MVARKSVYLVLGGSIQFCLLLYYLWVLHCHKKWYEQNDSCDRANYLTKIFTVPFLLPVLPGDEIIEVTVIDEGWMEGRVKSTGKYGMLPSNYVEKQ